MARLPQSLGNSAFLTFMGQCKDCEQLKETIACSQDCRALKQLLWSEDHLDSSAASEPLLIQEEIHRIGQLAGNVSELSKELKREISTLKEIKQKVRNRKNENVDVTKEIFASLRKALDEREEQIIRDIKTEGERRENILEFQLKKLVLLYSQLKNTLDLIKKTKEEEKVNGADLISRRKILEQRRDHLVVMKRKSQLELVRKEQRKIKFDGVEQLRLGVNQLGFIPLDPNKCEAAIPPSLIVNKETVVLITIRDINNDLVSDSSEELNVFVQMAKNGDAVPVNVITELDNGRYNAVFTPSRCEDHVISVKVDGHHILDSPFRIPADRDYSRITVQDCSQVLTHYEGKKFAGLTDVDVGPNDEVLIADYGNRSVIVLDRQLNLLRVIGQDSRLIVPFGIAVSDNIIAVSDHGSHQVKKYSLQGDLLSIIGGYGKNDGQFHTPKGLGFGYNKLLYVVDWGNHRVQVFQQDDEFAFSFAIKQSGPGKFHNPAKIAIDHNNNVLVSDFDDHFIYLFTHDGQLIKRICCFLPYAIAVSPTGYIIIDHHRDNNMITIYSPTHQLINKFGQRGSQQGDFDDIRGMAVGSTGDIYVVEGGNNRLQVISSK